MLRELFNLNLDLKRLRDEGYFAQIQGGLLLVREVPYVDSNQIVRRGTLISELALAGNRTKKPDHQVWFDGDYPCFPDGNPIKAISNETNNFKLGSGVSAKYRFSSKPEGGYTDYYHKLTTYAGVISGPAAVLETGATPRVYRQAEDEGDGVFNYIDTASYRAGIGTLSERLSEETVAIDGLGGSGSYVLDLVAKVPVQEIRLFDGDEFLQHNAFRAPGAPSLNQLREAPLKVDYFKNIYSQMHRNIVTYPNYLRAENLHFLDGVTFAFLCMDAGEDKKVSIKKLEDIGASFVDVGMGLQLNDGSLGGILRVTASTPQKREHVHGGRIAFTGGGAEDLYSSNIQVADLNSLNATLAVVKWKKILGFYRDVVNEHHCTYTTDGNLLINGDEV
ncbi:MAG: ThiF family adenylyltransferase [Zavarzinella sp.]